jgi:uncharacterized protein (DUF433 family)
MTDRSLLRRIRRDPEIMTGKPVIKGTRITVELILDLLAKDQTARDILKEYPELKPEDIKAALANAAAALGTEETHWVRTPA